MEGKTRRNEREGKRSGAEEKGVGLEAITVGSDGVDVRASQPESGLNRLLPSSAEGKGRAQGGQREASRRGQRGALHCCSV